MVPTTGEDIIGGTIGITDVVGVAPMLAGDGAVVVAAAVGGLAVDEEGVDSMASGGGGT